MSLSLCILQSSQARLPQSVFRTTALYGRATIYSRIHTVPGGLNRRRQTARDDCSFQTLLLRSSPQSLLSVLESNHSTFRRRQFSVAQTRLQTQKKDEEIRDPPRKEREPSEAQNEGSAKFSSEENSQQSSEGHRGENSEGRENETGKEEQEKKDPPPPPPPHGDKSPWQVFTETLRSEFKASKEWNDSTKALASSAHQFTENESVKKARAAYSAASGAATSSTSSALKNTGKALGQGAAWTWDTPVVKGVRAGVNATSKGIEKATRPVRETKVYQKAVGGVKDVIDDGSSSRYGGWVEKEERRKQRELRELNESGLGGKSKGVEKMEEDPK